MLQCAYTVCMDEGALFTSRKRLFITAPPWPVYLLLLLSSIITTPGGKTQQKVRVRRPPASYSTSAASEAAHVESLSGNDFIVTTTTQEEHQDVVSSDKQKSWVMGQTRHYAAIFHSFLPWRSLSICYVMFVCMSPMMGPLEAARLKAIWKRDRFIFSCFLRDFLSTERRVGVIERNDLSKLFGDCKVFGISAYNTWFMLYYGPTGPRLFSPWSVRFGLCACLELPVTKYHLPSHCP